MKFENKIPISITIGGKDVNKIRINGEVVWQKVEPVDVDYFYVENTYSGSNTISVKQTITGEPDSSLYSKTLQYSKDKTNWSTITLSSTTYNINLNQGERVYFRGNEGVFNHYVIRGTEQAYTEITANQSHNIGGNINTLLNYYNPNNLTLPQGVFNNLFRGNVNLVSAENLTLQPSSDGSLPVFAYLYLFSNCTSLIKPPVLLAKTLSKGSYYSLFDGCSKLDNLTVYTDDNSQTNCTYKWLSGVASTGTFNNMGGATYTKDSVSGIPTGWTEVKPDYFYVENTYNGSNTISVKQTIVGSPDSSTYAKTLQYSKDKTNWSTITLSSTTYNISLNQGERVYFRGNEGVLNYYGNDGAIQAVTNILGTQSHVIGGNINTLVNYITPNELTLTQGVFALLFQNNTTITSAENLTLPSTQIAEGCYRGLFYGCTSLTSIPEFPATELAPNCYRAMLANCTSLTTSTKLPATKLSTDCYRELFFKCSSLINPPVLPAEILAEGCYRALFYNCTSLNNITVYVDDISANNCITNWLSGVASSGTFNNYGDAVYTKDSASGIPTGWVEKKPDKTNYFYVKNEYDGTNNITFRAVRRPTETTIQQIEYSKDKINWTTEPITANIVITIPLEKGEKVYFRNDNGYFSNNLTGTSAFRIKIRATNNHSIGGDITTLYNYSYKSNVTIPEGCFRYLFGCDLDEFNNGKTYEQNPNLIDASQLILPQKTLSKGCYAGMFMLTTGLINPPQTIDCQTVGVESCHRMFKGSGITTTPSLSAKTIGTNGCTEMFMECDHITTMPTLQATSLGEYCFSYMFSNCGLLGGTITLPSTTTAKNCFSGMFESTAITSAIIKAKTLKQNCLTTTFKNCSNLNEVTVYATATSPSNLMISGITSNWLNGVASEGTFRNLGSITFDTDSVSGVPVGWQIVTE